ncbi:MULTISPECIES: nuclear transport factor 2 family protein [unclassified Ketobacter]|uniref:nuclear transport factor 2 family protein n=1 Tax=unclassified Ketobacter TaxID=2639109 RepID=UPI0025B9B775|nr:MULTISPECIES: nuclear transport factor 2 family protein [unclassified Ketobacter]MEC8810486.1 nuclear transport factor 2 family protein [Pseudomonadota bacterium]
MSLSEKQQRNLQILQTMAANGIKGNWDVVRPYVSDNLEMIMPEGLPYGKTYYGWDGYREGLAALGFWTDLAFAPGEMIPTDDKVIYLSHLSGKIASNGKSVSQPYVAVWEINNEKVVRITAFYFDTKEISDLAGNL